MTVRLSTGLRTLLAGTTGFGAAFVNSVMEIYSGAQPATADAAPTGTLLGVVTLASGAFVPGSPTNGLTFAPAVAGVVSKSGVWSFNGVNPGTAGWFRLKANAVDAGAISTTAIRADGSIATSGGDLNLTQITVAVGAPNTIDVFSFTVPAH